VNRLRGLFVSFVLFLSLPLSAAVSESELESLIEKVNRIYQPVAKQAGGELFFKFRRESSLAVASAFADGKNFWVTIYGGFYLSPRQTRDGLIFGICHELGHLFGGAPRRPAPFDYDGPIAHDGQSLLSSEGQSDYYAGLVCFREIAAGEDHLESLKGRHIPDRVIQECDRAWGPNTDSARICYRTALAAFDLLNLVRDFPISFDHPDTRIVERTNSYSYPSRQCRLDTAFAGALCQKRSRKRFNSDDPLADGCMGGAGARPACWFRLMDYL